MKYQIEDNFLRFWFRFVYKYRSAIEAGNLAYIKNIIRRDYNTYSGLILEKYFVEKLKTVKKFNAIGTYWEKSHQNEIDIVAVDDENKSVLMAEVKRQKELICQATLIEKSKNIIQQFQGYTIVYAMYSLEDM